MTQEEKKLPDGLEKAARKSAIAPFNLDVDEEHLYEYPHLPIAEQQFIEGAKWQKSKMLKDAVEIEVKEDAGGYPIVPLDAIELYDYENDKPLAKAGDKVKVIVIK